MPAFNKQPHRATGTLVVLLTVCWVATVQASGVIALENARVIDGTGAAPVERQTVVVSGGRIGEIFATGSKDLPPQADRIDLSGQTLLPGLIDGHVHLARNANREAALQALLSSGVTTVREMGGDASISKDLATRAASGALSIPAIHYAALFYGPPFLENKRAALSSSDEHEPGTAAWSRVVVADSDVAEYMRAARGFGATGVKLYASLDAPLLNRLSAAAHAEGLKVWTHSAVFPATVDEAVAAGADTIVHAKGMISLGKRDLPDNYREGVGTWVRAQDFAGTDPGSPAYMALFKEMVRRGTILEAALTADGDRRPPPLPPWLVGLRDWACRATEVAHRAGVIISAGTDTTGEPGHIQKELARLVECGLAPLEAIRAATLHNAMGIGIETTHGTIAVGKAADLVAVQGDPSQNVTALEDVTLVILNGRLMKSPQSTASK